MIIRVFRAKIRPGKLVEFKQMVQEQSIPWLTSSEGMLGYFAGEPHGADENEFVMVTLWRDVEALQSFAGENWQTPVVTPPSFRKWMLPSSSASRTPSTPLR